MCLYWAARGGQTPVGAHQCEVRTGEEEEVEGAGWGEGMALGCGL